MINGKEENWENKQGTSTIIFNPNDELWSLSLAWSTELLDWIICFCYRQEMAGVLQGQTKLKLISFQQKITAFWEWVNPASTW